MVLKLSDIELTITRMDAHYDANFGTWIRNEKNAALIGHHLSKYIDDYQCCDFIVVLKWIVRSWTLRSIIILSKNMLEDVKYLNNSRKKGNKAFKTRIVILTGLVYTWNSLFVSEFFISFLKNLSYGQKCKILTNVFFYFDREKTKEVLESMKYKIDKEITDRLTKIDSYLSRKNIRKEMKKGLEEAFLIN